MRKLDNLINAGTPPEPSDGANGTTEPSDRATRAPSPTPSLPVLYMPSAGYTTKAECGENFYRGMAARREYFLRDEQFVYIKSDPELGSLLHPLKASELQSEIELVFELVKLVYDRETKETILVPVLCSVEVADALLNCERAKRKYSLPLRLLASYPVLVEQEGGPVILGRGYHEDTGGIYIENDLTIPEIALPEAKAILLDVIADYNWAAPADLSRAVASFLGPGLKLGNILGGGALYPMDVALGDQSGAGKTHRMNLIAAIYGEKAFPVVLPTEKRGVGSPEEVLSGAILSGRLFASIDNARGKIDLPLLESILRGLGYIVARVAYSRGILAKTKRMLWQLTSNAASFPPDLINRALIVSHYKQSEGYVPKSSLGWGEVEPFQNIAKDRAELLGAIYGIIGEYVRRGKPRTAERRHDFRDYAQSLDWIVTELLDLPPLLDGHGTGQKILSDPAMGWLRAVTIALEKEGRLAREEWMASEIGEFCEENDIEIPGLAPRGTRGLLGIESENRNKQIGKLLGHLFKDIKSTLSPGAPRSVPLSNGKIRKILDERSFSVGPVDVRRHEITDTGDVKPSKLYYFEEIAE